MEQDKIASIGNCSGCQRMASLQDHACKKCVLQFGPKFGHLAKKMREDPGYRKKCFDALKSDIARARMVEMFGDAGYVTDPASMAGRVG